jgi:signal transduction histidine kinase
MQQNHARASGTAEVLSAIELVEDVLKMNAALIERHQIHIVREYAEVPSVIADRHKVVQILINLLQNASQALDEKGRADKELKLSVSLNGNDCVKIRLIDNGIGIEPANLTRIFAHGFTTRADGLGFGLHSGALAAKEMGGSLSAHSEGMGKGASFELELPIEKK